MTPRAHTVNEGLLRQYLLGRLEGTDRDRIEEKLFSEDAFLEHLELVRSALIDEYVKGSLDAGARADFERYVLPMRSARRELLVAEAIRKSGALGRERPARTSRRPFRPFWWPALTAAAMASAAAFGVLYFASKTQIRELAGREERLRVELARTGTQNAEGAGQEQAQVLTARIVRFDLTEDVQVRGEKNAPGPAKLVVPGAAAAVDFCVRIPYRAPDRNLRVRAPYKADAGYTASLLEIPARRTLWSGKPHQVEGRLLTFRAPRTALRDGPCRLVVNGERPNHAPEALAEFTFLVRLEP